MFTLRGGTYSSGTLAIDTNIEQWRLSLWEFEFQYLAEGHFDTQTAGVGGAVKPPAFWSVDGF